MSLVLDKNSHVNFTSIGKKLQLIWWCIIRICNFCILLHVQNISRHTSTIHCPIWILVAFGTKLSITFPVKVKVEVSSTSHLFNNNENYRPYFFSNFHSRKSTRLLSNYFFSSISEFIVFQWKTISSISLSHLCSFYFGAIIAGIMINVGTILFLAR